MPNKTGLLLINLGSPASANESDVREYLREFLNDPRVINGSKWKRSLLLNLVILPTRPKKSAKAYEKIWTPEGSPLLVNSQKFVTALQSQMPDLPMQLVMRYGKPNIVSGLQKLIKGGVEKIIIFPLYPQEAESSTGTAIAKIKEELNKLNSTTEVTTIPPFYNHTGFTHAMGLVGRQVMHDFPDWDHVLFSYHGLPVSHVKDTDSSGYCFKDHFKCCEKIEEANRHCYRAQCVQTTNLIAQFMGVAYQKYSMSFQSRLGRVPWITPYTQEAVVNLAKKGVKNLIVICPSFVADCLETLEEVGMQIRDQFIAVGGKELILAPCLNDDENWVHAAKNLVQEHL